MGADKTTQTNTGGKQKRRRFRLWQVLPALLLAFFAWRNWPLLNSHSEQEECTFGTDSTALYDRLRAEADAFLANHGKARLPGYSRPSAQIFADKVVEQLRAYGMEFGFNGPRDKEKLKSPLVVLSTGYFVQLPTLNWLCPVCYVFPLARFGFRLENRGDGVYDQISGALYITSFNIKASGIYYRASKTGCPDALK